MRARDEQSTRPYATSVATGDGARPGWDVNWRARGARKTSSSTSGPHAGGVGSVGGRDMGKWHQSRHQLSSSEENGHRLSFANAGVQVPWRV